MKISPELQAKIKKLHFFEHYTCNAIGKMVGLHRDTVHKYLYKSEGACVKKRIKLVDPFIPEIKRHIEQYPKIRSTQLFKILKDMGYKGAVDGVRRAAKPFRNKEPQHHIPQHFPPGYQGQVDWAHFPPIAMNKGERKLYLFVLVLSWSRAMYAEFTFDSKTDSFLRLHEKALTYLGGTPRNILYDNLKSAVLERFKDKVKFNPQLLEFSGMYGFDPKAARPYRACTKGRVERAIRYIRESFAVTANFSCLKQLNTELFEWLENTANKRPWPENADYSVAEKWKNEQAALLKLPSGNINPKQRTLTKSNKCSLIRFDCNEYSIPWKYARQQITVEADDFLIRFFYEEKLIAEHPRNWSKNERVISKDHWQKPNKSYDYVQIQHHPALESIFEKLIARGENYKRLATKFNELENFYGTELFFQAIRIAKKQEKFHPRQLGEILISLAQTKANKPQPMVNLSNKHINQLDVKAHPLDIYDLF